MFNYKRMTAFLTILAVPVCSQSQSISQLELKNGIMATICQLDAVSTSCQIDTGALITRINDQAFDSYPRIDTVRTQGISGSIEEYDLIKLTQIHIAGKADYDMKVIRLPTSENVQTMVGLDFIMRHRVTFDLVKHE